MPGTEKLLDWLHYILMAAGGIVLLARFRQYRRGGGRDPLRGSPIRASRLWPLELWLCLLGYALAATMGMQAARFLVNAAQPKGDHEVWRELLGTSLMQVFVIAGAIAAAPYLFKQGRRGLGLRPRPGLHVAAIGLAGWLAAVCICGLILLAIESIVEWLHMTVPPHDVFVALEDPRSSFWMRFVAIVGALLLAPIGEEIFYRGLVQTGIKKLVPPRSGSLYHRWVAITLTATLFAAMHFKTPHYIPALIALGVILGYLYERYGNLYIPILVHVLFNGKSLLWHYLLFHGPPA